MEEQPQEIIFSSRNSPSFFGAWSFVTTFELAIGSYRKPSESISPFCQLILGIILPSMPRTPSDFQTKIWYKSYIIIMCATFSTHLTFFDSQ